jgi:hypothetical protein
MPFSGDHPDYFWGKLCYIQVAPKLLEKTPEYSVSSEFSPITSGKKEKEFERRVQEDDEEEEEDQVCNRNGFVGRQSLRSSATSERPSQEAAERIQDVMRAAHERDESRNSMNKSQNSYTPPGRWTNSHAQMNGNAGVGRIPNNQNT